MIIVKIDVMPIWGTASTWTKDNVMVDSEAPVPSETLFDNQFQMDDLQVFDDKTLCTMLEQESFGLTLESLAYSLHGASEQLVKRVTHCLSPSQRHQFLCFFLLPISPERVEQTRRYLLDNLFWELTYWKTPELYEELIQGERLHPGIFQQLAQDIRGKVVLDAGAGSGRASLECLRYGASLVHAVEPSPGLLGILRQKITQQPQFAYIIPHEGRFDKLPLADKCVDLALSCSAFTALPEQGGEAGLAEMKRVTRSGGKIVLIWPRREDHTWLVRHDFHYVELPVQQEMRVHFRSLQSAFACAGHFYAHNAAVMRYLVTRKRPEVPFSVIGVNPPRDYCWLNVL